MVTSCVPTCSGVRDSARRSDGHHVGHPVDVDSAIDAHVQPAAAGEPSASASASSSLPLPLRASLRRQPHVGCCAPSPAPKVSSCARRPRRSAVVLAQPPRRAPVEAAGRSGRWRKVGRFHGSRAGLPRAGRGPHHAHHLAAGNEAVSMVCAPGDKRVAVGKGVGLQRHHHGVAWRVGRAAHLRGAERGRDAARRARRSHRRRLTLITPWSDSRRWQSVKARLSARGSPRRGRTGPRTAPAPIRRVGSIHSRQHRPAAPTGGVRPQAPEPHPARGDHGRVQLDGVCACASRRGKAA